VVERQRHSNGGELPRGSATAWGSPDHANDLSLAIGVTRIDQKVIVMQLGYQFNSYNLMYIQES
jgi:hypothetical protein